LELVRDIVDYQIEDQSSRGHRYDEG
jgi:hypothetical protein